jgi:hypothetical protein
MPKCTSGEFTLILSLLEILFLILCLFLFINVYIKIHNSYKCVYADSLGLFWTKAWVGERLISFML